MPETEMETREFQFPHEGQSEEVNPLEVEPALNSNDDVLSDEMEEEVVVPEKAAAVEEEATV